mmetsp:Transcript_11083/g.33226  ORF Transcript_11083/g.33226 Transcript_11083/m.33226 type:complete len:264 (-) Transcript_11083:117-908(-)
MLAAMSCTDADRWPTASATSLSIPPPPASAPSVLDSLAPPASSSAAFTACISHRMARRYAATPAAPQRLPAPCRSASRSLDSPKPGVLSRPMQRIPQQAGEWSGGTAVRQPASCRPGRHRPRGWPRTAPAPPPAARPAGACTRSLLLCSRCQTGKPCRSSSGWGTPGTRPPHLALSPRRSYGGCAAQQMRALLPPARRSAVPSRQFSQIKNLGSATAALSLVPAEFSLCLRRVIPQRWEMTGCTPPAQACSLVATWHSAPGVC